MTDSLKAELDWDEAGCNRRECQNGHTRNWGRCAYGIEPLPTLSDFEVFTASDGCTSGAYVTLSVEQVADWLRKQGYAVAKDRTEIEREVRAKVAEEILAERASLPVITIIGDAPHLLPANQAYRDALYAAANLAMTGTTRKPHAAPDTEPLIDPDCRGGKCSSCVGGPCEHHCHKETDHG